jgi:hypothetical protein
MSWAVGAWKAAAWRIGAWLGQQVGPPQYPSEDVVIAAPEDRTVVAAVDPAVRAAVEAFLVSAVVEALAAARVESNVVAAQVSAYQLEAPLDDEQVFAGDIAFAIEAAGETESACAVAGKATVVAQLDGELVV